MMYESLAAVAICGPACREAQMKAIWLIARFEISGYCKLYIVNWSCDGASSTFKVKLKRLFCECRCVGT